MARSAEKIAGQKLPAAEELADLGKLRTAPDRRRSKALRNGLP
jgi:hypothetical protein